MHITIIMAAAALALCVSGAGRVSLALDPGKLALGVHAGDIGMTLHIKFDL